MSQRIFCAAFAVLLATSAFAQETSRPVHTYSIVARDPATGHMGVAVQSHWFSVGSLVTWAEAGVGAVATQSFIDPAYGPLGLQLMRAGKNAKQALAAIIASDPGEAVRQVAMIDAQGNVAAHTGSKCIPAAGHYVGENFSVQANLMLNDKVWPAMKEAYQKTSGDLTDKMLAAMDAAQAVGGDIRGKQSAAILIVSGTNTGRPWADRVMELRVEDHPEPLQELRRLVHVHRAYQHMNAGDLAVEHNDMEKALAEYGAAQKMMPDNLEMAYWTATSLVNAGRLEESLPLFKKVFAGDPNWAELTPRLPGVGLLNVDEAGMKKILGVAPKAKK
ncbi:Zn-dependent protease [candidate division KSB1 bacterium]|nr:MAG: Zn-dependent protease [candidate division KSB1 bacterium]